MILGDLVAQLAEAGVSERAIVAMGGLAFAGARIGGGRPGRDVRWRIRGAQRSTLC